MYTHYISLSIYIYIHIIHIYIYTHIYIYIYIPRPPGTAHHEYTALARNTSVLRAAVLLLVSTAIVNIYNCAQQSMQTYVETMLNITMLLNIQTRQHKDNIK